MLAGKEKAKRRLALIRVRGDTLVLQTLFVAEDVDAEAEIVEAVAATETGKVERALARQVIERLAGDFQPAELLSEYRRDLRAGKVAARKSGPRLPMR